MINLLNKTDIGRDYYCNVWKLWDQWGSKFWLSHWQGTSLITACCYRTSRDWQSYYDCISATTRPEPYIRRFAGCPRTGGAAQDVHVAPGYGPWKQTSSRSITVWTQPGDSLRTEDDGSISCKLLRSSQGHTRDDDDNDIMTALYTHGSSSFAILLSIVRIIWNIAEIVNTMQKTLHADPPPLRGKDLKIKRMIQVIRPVKPKRILTHFICIGKTSTSCGIKYNFLNCFIISFFLKKYCLCTG